MENQNEKSTGKFINLINKLYARFHKSKIAQKLIGLTVTAATVLTLNSCQITITHGNGNDNEINNGENNNNENNNNQNNENNNKVPTSQTSVKIDLDDCSEFLQNILTNPTYDSLIEQIYAGNYDLLQRGEFKPHPYAFLQQEGFNVQSIMDGQTEAHTMSYVLDEEPNNLYIQTSVLKNNDHYCNYLLKYKLTDDEMEEYHMLHAGKSGADFFIQSMFANNEISKVKTPTDVTKTKIKKSTQESLTSALNNRLIFDKSKCNVVLLNVDNSNFELTTMVYPKYFREHQMKYDGKIANVTYSLLVYPDFQGDIYLGPGSVETSGNFLNQTIKDATLYLSQETNLIHLYCDYLEDK